MKRDKSKVIYASSIWDGMTFDEMKKEYIAYKKDDDEDFNDEEVNDEDIYDYMQNMKDIEWEDCSSEFLKPYFDNNMVLFTGSLGLWNGRRSVHKVLKSYDDFTSIISDYDDVKLYSENGKTYINLLHHDGTNSFEIKLVNEKHVDARIERLELYSIEDIDIDDLLKSYFTKKVNLHKEFYGA